MTMCMVFAIDPTTYLMKDDTVKTGEPIFEDAVTIIIRTGSGPIQLEKSRIDKILNEREIPATRLKLTAGTYTWHWNANPEYRLGIMMGDNIELFFTQGRPIGGYGRSTEDYYRYGLRYFYQPHKELNVKGTGGFFGLYYTNVEEKEGFWPGFSIPRSCKYSNIYLSSGYEAKLGIFLLGIEAGGVYLIDKDKLPSYSNHTGEADVEFEISLWIGTSV